MTLHLEVHRIDVTEPATGTLLGTVATADANAIASCVERARRVQKDWAELPGETRAKCLVAWRKLVVEHSADLACQLSRENGKPYHEALLHEVVALAEALDYIAETAPTLQRPNFGTPRWFKHRTHSVRRRPHGVAAILSPFNFPLLIPGADAAAAIAMGCSVILKPSPVCPLIGERIAQLAHRAGIPEEVFQVLHGGADVGQALVASGVDEVLFTGSMDNGRVVARQCGELLLPCTVELGGNCPLVVLDDADIDRTARAIACGAFTNSGQSCLAVGRVLVKRSLSEPLVDRLRQIVGKLRQGDPLSGAVDLGALSTRAQVERCCHHVEQATAYGAHAIAGRDAGLDCGNFFAPTLLAHCSLDCAAFQQETFGPVLPIVCFDDLAEVIALLNRSRSGLTAYVFGTDLERARSVAASLDYGQVVVDQVLLTYVCPEVPLAPLRDSGLGVVHGTEGLLAHTTPSVIGMPRLRLPTTLEFDWGDPRRALSIAEGYLASKTVWNKLVSWTRRKQ
jgi:acyl-CoA reductase-like NAD-dependent aldehyde dehydrogenase